ncbi:MAG: peptidase T [Pedobacter sp.]|nr:MAG: peptidase T [Pedobacter sp.]
MNKYNNDAQTLQKRFVRYAQIDTQSDGNSHTHPSTLKQFDLANLLVQELREMGVSDAHVDEYCYVYATIPSNTHKEVPVICFCSHMDTSPDCSGYQVKPLIHTNYQGQDLVLPDDSQIVIKLAEHPDLEAQIGHDIITASGLTLLGADNKAGVAEIMEAAKFFQTHPEVKHGTIKILFTPDEEIGRGVDKVNIQKLGADYAYTVDGETLGSIEDETFSADGATLTITGVSAHPGFAKGKMENALKIIANIIADIPLAKSPEGTSGKEGFIHPVGFSGIAEEAQANFILRDFDNALLAEHGAYLKNLVEKHMKAYPNAQYDLVIKPQYRNMKEVIATQPKLINLALQAIEEAGVKPIQRSIRGGTDGSRLSFMGLPCPNLFAGEHAFHSKQEWVSVQDMEKAVQTIINLICLWEKETA